MSAITQELLNQIRTAMVAAFNRGLAVQNDDWMKVAKLIPSSTASNTYAWLSQYPAFREWVGQRLHKTLKETAMQVVNRLFETTVDIPRTTIEDDIWASYLSPAEGVGISANDHKNALVFNALVAGFSSLCYDGQNFFDTDHPVYPNEDGTGTAATVSNMQDGSAEPWFLLCTKRAAPPIFLQERIAPQFDAVTSVQSPNVFDFDKYSFGGRWRGEVAYGFWQCAFGSKAALTEENFNSAYTAMMSVNGDGNRPLGVIADRLVVGPSNQAAAETLLKAITKANGASNTNYNKVELLVSPWVRATPTA